jgi:hypothetical protein
VHVDTTPGEPLERGKGALVAVDRHVPHAAAGLGAGCGRDHLIVAKKSAVEEDDVGASHACRHRRGHRGGAGDIDHAGVAGVKLDADIARSLARSFHFIAFEIERHFAGHCEQPRLRSSWKNERRCGNNRLALHHVGGHHAEHHIQ